MAFKTPGFDGKYNPLCFFKFGSIVIIYAKTYFRTNLNFPYTKMVIRPTPLSDSKLRETLVKKSTSKVYNFFFIFLFCIWIVTGQVLPLPL